MTGKHKAFQQTPITWRRQLVAMLGLSLLSVLALVSGPAHASDDPPGRVGRITESQGQAWQFDSEGGEWLALQRNRPITAGDRLSVEGGGRVELRIGSTAVRLDGATELEIRRLDDERIEMQLHNGSVALRVRAPEVAREIELTTTEGRFLPRRAGHYRIDRRDDTGYATAWSGEIRFEAEDSVLNVPVGRRAEFWQEGPQRATHYSWGEAQRDPFADWVAQANREDDRSASTSYVSPEMTGWEDLDRNGRWDTHPEYGALWVPTVVAAGWAPYRYGHWAWVRPWGWTWIDDAAWGFAPFHYGRWLMYGGSWCWAPGRRVARPIYAPALVAWVGGPAVGAGVVVGGPLVGWVPLAPREVFHPYYQVSSVYLRGVNAGHRHLHPDPTPRVPTGPIMYTNQGVPGAVTVVPSNVLTARRPVAPAIAQVDLAVRNNLARQPWQRQAAPPAPSRVIAVPGGAVPAQPHVVRPGPPPRANVLPGTAPQVNDLRRERIPQRQTPQVPSAAPQAQAPNGSVQTAPGPRAQPPAQIATAQPSPVTSERHGDEPGVRRDLRGRQPMPNAPAPVRVDSPRVPGVPSQPAQPAPQPPRPAPPSPAIRQPMPAQPLAAREVQRVPQPAEREVRERAPESRSNNPRNQMQ